MIKVNVSSQNSLNECRIGHRNIAKRGFALIATISVMALLAMIALAMLSLSTIETRAENTSAGQAEAQANARLALMLAIGDLQKQMGPDQRISATADQINKPGSDGEETLAAVGNKHWTGTYDAWLSTSTDRPSPAFREWLMSGDPTLLSQLSTAATELSGNDSIELVSTGTVGDNTDGLVRVPAINLSRGSNQNGRMAWWVGDQGVKAALGTPPAAEGNSLAVVRNNLQSAPRNAVELASVGAVKPFSGVTTDDPRMPRVTGWQQAAHLTSDPAAPRPLFHDLSAFSTGLLTNVREGGFRKDLSMKLETYTDAPDLSNPENVLYTVKSDMTGNDEIGINFMELWSYYHLYKELSYSTGLNYTTGGTIPSNSPYLQTKKTQAELNTDPWDRLKHPITINYQTIYSLEADPHPSEQGKYV
ncbi:MAG: hypothetical protein AB8F34_04460, partial [Akkermansiaceae bacterium]